MDPIPLTPWLEHLARHLPIAREGVDPEGVHQVRVAAGRLDVWLELAGMRVLRDDLDWLRGSASHLRELDVLLGSDPPAVWVPWLEERREGERRRFLAAIEQPRLAGLLAALPQLSPLAPARAHERLERSVARAAKRGRKMEEDPTHTERCHRLRKVLRRVRYALEWFEESTKPIKALQDSLGELNDASVALTLLAEWPQHEQLADYRRTLEERVEHYQKQSIKRWKRSALRAEVAG